MSICPIEVNNSLDLYVSGREPEHRTIETAAQQAHGDPCPNRNGGEVIDIIPIRIKGRREGVWVKNDGHRRICGRKIQGPIASIRATGKWLCLDRLPTTDQHRKQHSAQQVAKVS
jgi:hypothetical protein